jgi:hypothetical protein
MATTRNRNLPLRVRVVASFVTGIALTALTLSPWSSLSPAQAACVGPVLDCTAGSIAGTGVTLVRSKVIAGSPATPSKKVTTGTIIVVPKPNLTLPVLNLQCSVITPRPWYCPVLSVVRVTPAVAATPALTIADLASFVPQSPGLASEPAGWGIVGLPVNFIALEPTHDVAGSLLGQRATVRFTPVSYSWSYGDSQARAGSAPGATWLALKLPTFSATPTSHTYSKAGVYTVTVSVHLSATYRIASGSWQSISGSLTRTASISVRLSAGAIPVLVADGCLAHPEGIGC